MLAAAQKSITALVPRIVLYKSTVLCGFSSSSQRQLLSQQRVEFRTMAADDSAGLAELKRAAAAIHGAKALVFTSGAGMGVDSGLPDFRGPEGFWRAYPALRDRGIMLPSSLTS